MMRKKIVAGNWKMNKTPSEAINLAEMLKSKVDTDKCDVVFCVPAIDIIPVSKVISGTNIKLGAQNMHFEDSGAYTGEISASMLKDAGVSYVILGHSERRAYFSETNEMVNKKTAQALKNGLIPIICVGETLLEREMGITMETVRMQVKLALTGIEAKNAKGIVFAYEPVWAIGTGKTATKFEAEEVCEGIRNVLSEIYGKTVSSEIRIQYGGSVNGKNAAELFEMENIDGGLIGGASLKEEFSDIVSAGLA
ncbi:MAG: triose-phosphate isomerase [Lachnospiraceae bacterium]|nr:triose-phosphate isomerase [Lachnospiraceae bacterium]